MSKDTGELIKKKSINLCCLPIFSYISSLIIVPNAPFSQSLSHIYVCMCTKKIGILANYRSDVLQFVAADFFCTITDDNSRHSL